MSNPNTLPDEVTLASAAQLDVYDAQGKKVKFGSIYGENKTVVVFIRTCLCSVGAYIPIPAHISHFLAHIVHLEAHVVHSNAHIARFKHMHAVPFPSFVQI